MPRPLSAAGQLTVRPEILVEIVGGVLERGFRAG